MGKILPVVMALAGLGGGLGGGYLLRPAPDDSDLANPCATAERGATAAKPMHGEPAEVAYDYIKLNNQFVVPVVTAGKVEALVIISLSLEVSLGATEQVYALEPKLRDGFLQVLFDHANAGGFDGAFTDANNMTILRRALLETAQKTLGSIASDVLISDVIRQDG